MGGVMERNGFRLALARLPMDCGPLGDETNAAAAAIVRRCCPDAALMLEALGLEDW